MATALIVSHPGHELRVFHWLETTKPLVLVLTDGSGSMRHARLESTTALLKGVGARPARIYGAFADADIYTAILQRREGVFLELLEEIATFLVEEDIDLIVGDAMEGYNPSHDLCRYLIGAAVVLASPRARQLAVIGNAVDLQRFLPRKKRLPQKPRRALLFSNYASEYTHLPPVRQACAQAAIELDVCGTGVGNVCEAPEKILGNYDVVFAKARCAMEAMVVGAAVVLCGAEGCGPLVVGQDFERLRKFNFGRHVLPTPLSADYLFAQLASYNAHEAARVSELARRELGLDASVEQWLGLYAEILSHSSTGIPSQTEVVEAANLLLLLEPKLFSFYELDSRLAWYEAEHRKQYERIQALEREPKRGDS